MKIIEDVNWIKDHLVELTAHNEQIEEKPWKITDAPDKYIIQQLKGIIGVEIDITKLIGKCKAGQNKKQPELEGMVKSLGNIDQTNAKEMSKVIKSFYDN